MSGSIYKITCQPTGLMYVGQTCDIKYRKGTPYTYGPRGRWSDHVSSAKKSGTPLSKAIQEHGREQFTVEVLESDLLERLDELEAKWIAQLNTVVPHGLNVMSHSREKHRTQTTIQHHYKALVASASIHPIRRKGEYALVYVQLVMKDGTTQRMCFGQDGSKSFEEALKEARYFAEQLECPIRPENERIAQFNGKVVTKVRITSASNLVAVYVTTSDMTTYKDQKRICFGGKMSTQQEAYVKACEFVDELLLANGTDSSLVEDLMKCWQQVATAKGDAPPSQENSVSVFSGSSRQ